MFGPEGRERGPVRWGEPVRRGGVRAERPVRRVLRRWRRRAGRGGGRAARSRRGDGSASSRWTTSCSVRARHSTSRCRSSASGARAAAVPPGTHPDRCPTCEGSGEVRQVRRSLLGQIVTAGPCSACGATGQVIPNPCEECGGAGRVNGSTSIDVDVPPRHRRRSAAAPLGPGSGRAARRAGRRPLRVGARRAPSRARTARRRALVPLAGLDRAGRARDADRDHDARRRARDRRRRRHAAGRADSGCAGSVSRRCARRGAAISSSRSASTSPCA